MDGWANGFVIFEISKPIGYKTFSKIFVLIELESHPQWEDSVLLVIPKRARKFILKDGTAFQLVDHFIVKKKYFIFVVTVRFQLSVL